jgi:peptidoglycan/xylan/chitin deacetylase (PgdA/CDA1 family)
VVNPEKGKHYMLGVVKSAVVRIFYIAGLASFLIKQKSRGKALILSYHHVIPRRKIDEPNIMPGMYLSSEAFQEEIEWLQNQFDLVPLEEIIEKIRTGLPWEYPLCAITFDDGWKDVYEHAFPILKRAGVPATVFLVGEGQRSDTLNCFDSCFEVVLRIEDLKTEISGVEEIDAIIGDDDITDKREKARLAIHTLRGLPYDKFVLACNNLTRHLASHVDYASLRDKYQMLSIDNIKHMSENGVGFGYHSKSHYILTRIPESLLDDELVIPTQEYLSAGIDLKPVFCYPDGQYNGKIISVLKNNGYQGAVTLNKGYNTCGNDPFVLRRINLHEGNAGSLPLFLTSIGILNR